MYKHLFFFIFLIPIFGFSQNNNFSLEIQKGVFEDVLQTDFDINSFSSDMSSSSVDYDDNSTRLSIYYSLKDRMQLAVFYGQNFSKGENSVEFYETTFDEYGIILEYDFFETNGITLFANLFASNIEFSSSRYFIGFDEFAISSVDDQTNTFGYGAGIKYKLSDKISLLYSQNFYDINHDGFDGWDYDSGIDKLIYRSLSVRFEL